MMPVLAPNDVPRDQRCPVNQWLANGVGN